MHIVLVVGALASLLACGSNSKSETSSPPPSAQEPIEGGEEPAERPVLTVEECEAQGTVVGDIGDGATHRPDYLCPNGEPPIGSVALGIEGSVCCPK